MAMSSEPYHQIPTAADANDDDMVEEGRGSCCAENVLNPMTYYKIPRELKVKSRWLAVPKCASCWLSFIGMFVYSLWFLKFWKPEPIVSARSIVELSTPQRNFNSCHDGDYDCADEGAEILPAPAYCSPKMLEQYENDADKYFFSNRTKPVLHQTAPERWSTGIRGHHLTFACHRGDIHDVQRQLSNSMLIATTNTRIKQKRCPEKHECIWKTEAAESSFIKNIEKMRIKLRTSALWGSRFISNQNATGFITGSNPEYRGQKFLIACDKAKEDTGVCMNRLASATFNGSVSGNARSAQPCGSPDKHTNTSDCMSTGFADFISLERLLDFAGIDLDEPLEDDGHLPRRWWGGILKVDVKYSNNINATLLTLLDPRRIVADTLQYTVDVQPGSTFFWMVNQDVVTREKTPTTRELIRQSGLLIDVSVHGDLLSWDIYYLFSYIATFAVCLKIGGLVVDKILLGRWNPFNMRCCLCTQRCQRIGRRVRQERYFHMRPDKD